MGNLNHFNPAFDAKYDQLADLERSLQNNLLPIRPSQIFVDELKDRLSKAPQVALDKNPLTAVYLIFAFGLFAGVFIFWLVRKIVRSGRS